MLTLQLSATNRRCHECDAGWTRTGDANCTECIDFRLQALIFAFGATLGVLACIFLIRRTINSRGSVKNVPQIMMLKIVVTHCQIVAMANSFPLEWPGEVRNLFEVLDYTSSAGTEALDLSCIIVGENRDAMLAAFSSVFFIFGLCVLLAPVLFAIFAALFWIVVKRRHDVAKAKDKGLVPTESGTEREGEVEGRVPPPTPTSFHRRSPSGSNALAMDEAIDAFQAAPSSFKHFNFWLVSMVVFFFVVQPSITRIGLRFFACSQNEDLDGRHYLQTDFAVECYKPSHNRWSMLVGLPILLFYGAGVPLLALAVLRRVIRDGDSVEEALKKWRAVFG